MITVHRELLAHILEMVHPLVPSKPLQPEFGGIHFRVHDGVVYLEVANGRVWAQSMMLPDSVSESHERISHIVPDDQFYGMIHNIIDTEQVNITFGDGCLIEAPSWTAAMPVFKDDLVFPPMPEIGDVLFPLEAGIFRDALLRCEYAAVEGNQAERRVIIFDGSHARAYDQANAQEVLFTGSQRDTFPVPVEIAPMAAKFLSPPGVASGATVDLCTGTMDESPFYIVHGPGFMFAYRAPQKEPLVSDPLWEYADDQMGDSAELRADRLTLLTAAKAAQELGDPAKPVLDFDLPDGDDDDLVLSTNSPSGSSFEKEVTGVQFTGNGENVQVGVNAFIKMLEAVPDETVRLLIFQGRPKKDGRRMVQVVASDGARGVTPVVGPVR